MDNNTDKLKITLDYTPGSKWSLSNDVDLLKRLEKFSEGVINKASRIQKCMDELEDSVISAYLQVKEIGNEFHTVGDTQFIENRTCDEDETLSLPKLQQHTNFPSNEDPITSNKKLEESLSNCLQIIEDKFETIQLSESDSDDDGLEHSQVVLKPRKCYVDRPLPHIIGNYEFLNDPTLGLSPFLPEQEDTIETEDDEACTLYPRNYQDSTLIIHNTEQSSESISLSRKSLDDSLSSYEVVANDVANENTTEQDNKIWKNIVSSEPEAVITNPIEIPHTDQDIVDRIEPKSKLSSSIQNIDTISKSKDNENEFLKSDDNFDKLYSKKMMKNKLEQIYSHPRQDLFSKNTKKEAQPMDVEESKEKILIRKQEEELMKSKEMNTKVETSIKNDVPQINPFFQESSNDDLPDLSTKTLHCVAKNRAKNPNKRRLPSRRGRDNGITTVDESSKNLPYSNSTKVTPSTKELPTTSVPDSIFNTFIEPKPKTPSVTKNSNQNSSNNNLLSPATDEEDLFTVIGNTISSNDTTDRLFKPLQFPTSSNIQKKPSQSERKQEDKPKTSIWDPFTDDDDDSSLFQSNDTWSAQKFTKRSDKPLGGLVSIPSDENLFSSSKETSNKSLFDDITIKKEESVKTIFDNFKTSVNKSEKSQDSLFDDIDDEDSLFSSNFTSKKIDSDLKQSSISNSTKTKKDFLSDPLAFGNDSETE